MVIFVCLELYLVVLLLIPSKRKSLSVKILSKLGSRNQSVQTRKSNGQKIDNTDNFVELVEF